MLSIHQFRTWLREQDRNIFPELDAQTAWEQAVIAYQALRVEPTPTAELEYEATLANCVVELGGIHPDLDFFISPALAQSSQWSAQFRLFADASPKPNSQPPLDDFNDFLQGTMGRHSAERIEPIKRYLKMVAVVREILETTKSEKILYQQLSEKLGPIPVMLALLNSGEINLATQLCHELQLTMSHLVLLAERMPEYRTPLRKLMEPLVVLGSQDWIKHSAVEILGLLGDASVWKTLEDVASTSPSLKLRSLAIQALGRLDFGDVAEPLLRVMWQNQDHESIQREVALTLRKFRLPAGYQEPRDTELSPPQLISALYAEERVEALVGILNRLIFIITKEQSKGGGHLFPELNYLPRIVRGEWQRRRDSDHPKPSAQVPSGQSPGVPSKRMSLKGARSNRSNSPKRTSLMSPSERPAEKNGLSHSLPRIIPEKLNTPHPVQMQVPSMPQSLLGEALRQASGTTQQGARRFHPVTKAQRFGASARFVLASVVRR